MTTRGLPSLKEICFVLMVCLAVIATSCIGRSVEVARITSPDGKFDAIIISREGATTSFWYDLRVVERGKQYTAGENAASIYGALRNVKLTELIQSGRDQETLSSNTGNREQSI